jgi:hypothetical protein
MKMTVIQKTTLNDGNEYLDPSYLIDDFDPKSSEQFVSEY